MNTEEDDGLWVTLVDSGYQGLQRLVPVVLPQKHRPGRELNRDQRHHNRLLAQHRVVCEHFYGRLKAKWRIMATKYRNSGDNYNTVFKLCAALINYSS